MGGSKQTQTTKSNPWEPAQAGLKDVLGRAQTLGNDESLWKPSFSATTNNAIGSLANLGKTPSFGASTLQGLVGQTNQGMGAGMGQLMHTANGGNLTSNPYLDQVLAKAKQDAADSINAQFSAAGRYGSGAQTTALTRELGGIEANARMSDYGQERQNQLNAAQLLGNLGMQGGQLSTQVDGLNAQQIGYGLQAGQMKDAQAEAKRMAPVNALNWQAGITSPIASLGGDSTSVSKKPANIGGMIGGGLMAGLGVMTGNPMMAMGGLSGVAGGLSGDSGGGSMPSMGGGSGQPFFGAFSGGPYASNSMFNLNKLY